MNTDFREVRKVAIDPETGMYEPTETHYINVRIDPALETLGRNDVGYSGTYDITLRQIDDRVLLHELIHVMAGAALTEEQTARLEVGLWRAGYRRVADANPTIMCPHPTHTACVAVTQDRRDHPATRVRFAMAESTDLLGALQVAIEKARLDRSLRDANPEDPTVTEEVTQAASDDDFNNESVVAVVHTGDPETSIRAQNAGFYEAIRQVIDELEGYADEGSDHIAYLQDFAMHITTWLPPEERLKS
jgi:hypothetical protein